MKATRVGYTTLVGSSPLVNGGNCMSLVTEKDEVFYCVNLRYEPLKATLNAGEIDWPIEVEEIQLPNSQKRCCKVTDIRVPKERLTDDVCANCAGIPSYCAMIEVIAVIPSGGTEKHCRKCAAERTPTPVKSRTLKARFTLEDRGDCYVVE